MQTKHHTPIALLTLILLTGCSDGSLSFERASVTGTITYKNKPLESGLITFMPDTEMIKGQVAGKPVYSRIEQGKYSIPLEKGATVGKNRVEIVSFRKTGRTIKEEGGSSEEQLQFLPSQYNSASTLTTEITPGQNTANFNLD